MDATPSLHEQLVADLARFVRARVRGAADADDVLQDALLRIQRGLPGLRDQTRLLPWVHRVARSAIIDHARRGRARRAAPLPVPEHVPAAEDAPDDAADDLVSCLPGFLDALSPDDRDALVRVDVEGMSQAALAQTLGIAASAARSRVQRARARLRAALESCCRIERDRLGGVIDVEPRDGSCDAGCG